MLWALEGIVNTENNNSTFLIKQYNVWDYEWFTIDSYKSRVRHPEYYNQKHDLTIVVIFIKNYQTIRFGYSEYSNGVYGIYLPKKNNKWYR